MNKFIEITKEFNHPHHETTIRVHRFIIIIDKWKNNMWEIGVDFQFRTRYLTLRLLCITVGISYGFIYEKY